MAIVDVKNRALALAEKTDVNSITPKEVGGIMHDLASYSEAAFRNGGTLGIRQVYKSVDDMYADTVLLDVWGNPLKKGNLVVIYDGTTTGPDNNKIFAFLDPGWKLATELDAGYATKAETDAKLSELGSEVNNLKGESIGSRVINDTHKDVILQENISIQKGHTIKLNVTTDIVLSGDCYFRLVDSSGNRMHNFTMSSGSNNYDFEYTATDDYQDVKLVVYKSITDSITFQYKLIYSSDFQKLNDLNDKVTDLSRKVYDRYSFVIPSDYQGTYPKNERKHIAPSKKLYVDIKKLGYNRVIIYGFDKSNTWVYEKSLSNIGSYILELNVEISYIQFNMPGISSTETEIEVHSEDLYTIINGKVDYPINASDTTFANEVKSVNLINNNNWILDKYIKIDGTIGDSTSAAMIYIKLEEFGTYYTKLAKTFFGSNYLFVNLFDANYGYVKTIVPTEVVSADDYPIVSFEYTEAERDAGCVFVGLTMHKSTRNFLMLSKDSYPSHYIPHYIAIGIEGMEQNPLIGKMAIFDGDSICEAYGLTGNQKGWAGIIGERNKMAWINVGISGGTITQELYTTGGNARHWISQNIDTIYANYPNADYIILEGGTNDADLIGNESKIGEIDMYDFSGNYDATTYCGALDTLFFKASSYFPNAKVGFIIAQKMGRVKGASNNALLSNQNRRKFFDIAKQACVKWGIPCIDLWEEGFLNPNIDTHYDGVIRLRDEAEALGLFYYDGQHLTVSGYKRMSDAIESWMKSL